MHATSPAPTTVSIVSHGQQALMIPLLEQLERYCRECIAQVVVTVNVPETALIKPSDWSFPVEMLENRRPQGFGANHNAAFAYCRTPWFLVLNPDIRLDADVLGTMLGAAAPSAGVLAPRIHEPAAHRSGPEPHRGLLTPCEIVRRNRPGYRTPPSPAWVAGMFMLFRADAFRQVGGFDERFFMYGEDFDVCARLRLAGSQIQIFEDLRVRHEARRASRKDWRHLHWHVSSLMRVWTSPAFWRYRALLRAAHRACGG